MLMLPASAPGRSDGTAEVTEDGRTLVLRVLAAQAALGGDEGIAAAGVHDVARLDVVARAAVGAHLEARVARPALLEAHDLVPLARPRAALAGVLVQHAVEVLAPHLEGVRRAVADGALEREGVVAALVVGLEVGAGLVDPQRPHLLQHAEPLEYRQVHRQQRLADVEARVMGLLERDHVVAAARQQRRRRAAGRAAADHHDVAGLDDRRRRRAQASGLEMLTSANQMFCQRAAFSAADRVLGDTTVAAPRRAAGSRTLAFTVA